jgi:hypothetical protein
MARVALIRLKAPFRRLTVGDVTTVAEEVGTHLEQQSRAAVLARYDPTLEEVDERTHQVRPRRPPRPPHWVLVELPEGELVERLVSERLAVEVSRYEVGKRPASVELPAATNGHAPSTSSAPSPATDGSARARARS